MITRIDEHNQKTIEKLLQRKYPGIKISWFCGYDNFTIIIPDDLVNQEDRIKSDFNVIYGRLGGKAEFTASNSL